MDLADLDTAAAEPRAMPLKVPGGAPILDGDNRPVTITLISGDSPKAVAMTNELIDKRTKEGRAIQSAQEADELKIWYAARCTIGWSGIKVDGALLEFNQANAMLLYRRFPWLREQVELFVMYRPNFFKMPSTT